MNADGLRLIPEVVDSFRIRCEDCADVATIVLGRASARSRAAEHHEVSGHTVRMQAIVAGDERIFGDGN